MHQHAARLFGAAAAIRDDKGIARFPMYQASYDAAVESSRDALGEEAFDAAWAEGAALSIEAGDRLRPARSRETQTAHQRLGIAHANRDRTLCGSSAKG